MAKDKVQKTLLSPDDFFTRLLPPLNEVAWAIRALLLTTMPDLREEIKFGTPFYLYKGWVCYLNVTKEHVDLGFTSGLELSDVFQLFDQRGLKQVRHIKIPDLNYIEQHQEGIANYILEACVRNDIKSREKAQPRSTNSQKTKISKV